MEDTGMVIDTSVFIEFLRAKNKSETTLFQIPEENQLYKLSATAIANNLPVKTLNVKHFSRIPNISMS
jgi:predicted nucleic acid-binding protein